MPAKKSAAKKPAAKSKSINIRPLYAVPIYAAIKRGNKSEMMEMGAQARKHISDIAIPLSELEKKLGGS